MLHYHNFATKLNLPQSLTENSFVSKGILIFIKNTLHIFSWLLIGLCMSLPTQADSPLPLLLPLATSDIQLQLHPENYHLINVQHGATQIEIPVLNFASEQALTKGTVVLLSDLRMQQSAESKLYKLAKTLPKWGWHTIFVTPKTEYFMAQAEPIMPANENDAEIDAEPSNNESETASPQSNESSNEASANEPTEQIADVPNDVQTGLRPHDFQASELGYTREEYSAFMQSLLTQINTTFLQKPGYQILMVQGKTASVALALLNTQSTLTINALVLNNPYWPEYEINRLIPTHIAQLTIPVLDLVSLSDNQWSLQTQQNRVTQTRVMLKSFYRQREIYALQHEGRKMEYVAKEVVAWTRYLGW